MYANEVIWQREDGRRMWGTSDQCCIMKKVRPMRKEVTTGERFYFFWTLLHSNKAKTNFSDTYFDKISNKCSFLVVVCAYSIKALIQGVSVHNL